eukprot:m.486772 g.486772  ORF g.486772 m.486772 type:complete len:129 (-) comp24588_c0_seq1:443-829(-)
MVSLDNTFKGQPFVILAFPCNEFLHQEPKANSVIKQFALAHNYTDPLFAKSDVNDVCKGSTDQCAASSADCCPTNNGVYEFLKSKIPGKVQWNFYKYLVGKDGVPMQRFNTAEYANKLQPAVQKALSS